MFKSLSKSSSPSWNASLHAAKIIPAKSLPWKKPPPPARVIASSSSPSRNKSCCGQTQGFTDMTTVCGHEDDDQEGHTQRLSSSDSSPHSHKHNHNHRHKHSRSPLSTFRGSKVSPLPSPSAPPASPPSQSHLRPKTPHSQPRHRPDRNSNSSGGRPRRISNNFNNNSSPANSSRRYFHDSSPASSSRRYIADDDDEGGHQHSHLITFQVNGLDTDGGGVMNQCSSRSNASGDAGGGSIACITPQRSFATEDDTGDGWSVGVRKFQLIEGVQPLSCDSKSVFAPSDSNVAGVPSASHARDSLLKKEFFSIKQSLAHSYKKYRDKRKTKSSDRSHAVAYQYVDQWLKNKKVAGNQSRISKNEFAVSWSIFCTVPSYIYIIDHLPFRHIHYSSYILVQSIIDYHRRNHCNVHLIYFLVESFF
jgi:hypothetical protein